MPDDEQVTLVDDNVRSIVGYAVLLTAASLWALWSGFHRARYPLGTTAGLHLHVLLYYGLGSLAYVLADGYPDRLPRATVLDYTRPALRAVAIGYAAVVALATSVQYIGRQAGPHNLDRVAAALRSREAVALLAALAPLSVLGILFSDAGFATSGVGTLVIVFRLFVYPVIICAVVAWDGRRTYSAALIGCYLAVIAALSLATGWRSQLIFFAVALLIGWLVRAREIRLRYLAGLVVTILALLPFVDLKKKQYERTMQDPLGTFGQTLAMPPRERLRFLTEFWGVRVNGAREAAYVQYGLASGATTSEQANTYVTALKQLVPRAVWPDKPSYNGAVNYDLARAVRLVDRGDPTTSWGVELFAEAVWNFGVDALAWFVPAAFFAALVLDRIAAWGVRTRAVREVVRLSFCFEALALVGVVTQGTYLLWIIVVGMILDSLIRTLAQGAVGGRAHAV